MGKIIRVILLTLLISVILSLIIATGCSDKKPDSAGEFSQEELSQIIAETILNSAAVDSCKVRTGMSTFLNIQGGSRTGSISVEKTTEMVIDQANNEMEMCTTECMVVMVGGEGETKEETADLYLLDGQMYANINLLGLGKAWWKMQATEEVMSNYGLNQIDDTLSLLETAGEMSFLRYESLNGSECYVIELVPDMGMILDEVNALDVTGEQYGLGDMDIIKDLTYTCWINKETKLLEKSIMYVIMEFSGKESDAWSDDAVLMMDMTTSLEIYEYNQPVTINLPEEALDAINLN